MNDFLPPPTGIKFEIPTILIVGTSMSAGKTTIARMIIQQLKNIGLRVVGAKLTGSGRFRDILSMRDAGADYIFDFVDVGLPTTVVQPEAYRVNLNLLLSLIASVNVDVAVLEIGASPLEPYNGDVAIDAIKEFVNYTVLCATDPYSVVGVMTAYGQKPDLVAGVATNTEAGIALIEKLTGVKALNLMDREALWQVRDLLRKALGLELTDI
jgi:uncharacterized NAD-dependent epimerase/dehydratase family protein